MLALVAGRGRVMAARSFQLELLRAEWAGRPRHRHLRLRPRQGSFVERPCMAATNPRQPPPVRTQPS
jgi:hypothetical protein|eukprot:COSAG03_NODE_36_length_17658_cov_56.766900_4_plen_67_part_00